MRQIGSHPLWIGHAGDGRDFARLHESGIRALVQLAIEEPVIQPPRDLIYVRIPLSDGAGNRADLLTLAILTVSGLLSRRVPTLLFCSAGMSRAPCVAAASLAVTLRQSPDAGLGMVTSQGPRDVSSGLWREMSDLVAAWRHDAGAS